MFKRILAFTLIIAFCFFMCSCDKITYGEDSSIIYYNGYTYKYQGYQKYRFDFDSEMLVLIDVQSYFILGITEYYGNNKIYPEFITSSRSKNLYLREDIIFDDTRLLSIKDIDTEFTFRISDITLGTQIDEDSKVNELYDFWVTMCDYPYISLHIGIFESNGKFYLQDEYFTDYKEITPDFVESLSALNLK